MFDDGVVVNGQVHQHGEAPKSLAVHLYSVLFCLLAITVLKVPWRRPHIGGRSAGGARRRLRRGGPMADFDRPGHQPARAAGECRRRAGCASCRASKSSWPLPRISPAHGGRGRTCVAAPSRTWRRRTSCPGEVRQRPPPGGRQPGARPGTDQSADEASKAIREGMELTLAVPRHLKRYQVWRRSIRMARRSIRSITRPWRWKKHPRRAEHRAQGVPEGLFAQRPPAASGHGGGEQGAADPAAAVDRRAGLK